MSESVVSPDGPADSPGEATKRPWVRRMALGAALLVLTGFLVLWLLTRNQETTDDAFIESNVVQISPHVGGYVTRVLVNDNQWVKAGELLAEIDARDYELRVKQAEAALAVSVARHGAARQDLSVTTTTTGAGIEQAAAQVAAAQAQAELAHSDLARYRALYERDELSKQRLDQALTADRSGAAQLAQAQAKLAEARSGPRQIAVKQAQAESGQASVEEARAALDQTRLDLSYTRLLSPVEGRIAHRALYQGQLLQPGPSVMGVVYGTPWVIANFKETQLRRMRVGQTVEVAVDAFPGRTFKAHVDSFQPGTGARFSLLPPENASGNYVKVVQRVPVKIVFDEQPEDLKLLVPGMSVEPKVKLADSVR